ASARRSPPPGCSLRISGPRRSSGRTRSPPCWSRCRPAMRSAGSWPTGALSIGGFLGSLAAVLVLVAVPVLLLGMVAPYANRLAVARVADTGTVTGRLYAISTAGSLLGTFLAALLLIPLIG